MTPGAQERAAAFFRTYPPSDADWYRDEVLIPALTAALAQAVQAERADVLAYLDMLAENHPHAAHLYRHAAHQITSVNHDGCATLRARPAEPAP